MSGRGLMSVLLKVYASQTRRQPNLEILILLLLYLCPKQVFGHHALELLGYFQILFYDIRGCSVSFFPSTFWVQKYDGKPHWHSAALGFIASLYLNNSVSKNPSFHINYQYHLQSTLLFFFCTDLFLNLELNIVLGPPMLVLRK